MGLGTYGTKLAFDVFSGSREIAENADADMRDRENLAFEIACG